ncbi:MAG: Lrp/AsnC family transcriptional regulator [bacterium]
MARRLGMSEEYLLLKIKKLKQKGYIRRIGGIVSPRHLGYKSVLIGACVPEEKVYDVTSFVNRSDNVSHNYLRDSEYNVWFTFSAKTKKEIDNFIQRLKNNKGIADILILPSKKMFKLNTEFCF